MLARVVAMTRTPKLALFLALASASCASDDKDDPTPPTQSEGDDATAPGGTPPTWHANVAPLVQSRCAGCHRAGGIAPFSLESYASARPYAASIASAVESGTMPPFLADSTAECAPRHAYYNDPRLSKSEKAMLRAWADTGASEGDATKAAPIEKARSLDLEREDVVMTLPQPISVPHGGAHDIHTCLIVDPKLSADSYVTGRQIKPGNAKILHHVVLYMIKPVLNDGKQTRVSRDEVLTRLRSEKGVGIGERYDCFGGPGLETTGLAFENLGGWAPGSSPGLSPPDSGQPMAKDALVILDLHYHATAHDEEDRSTALALMLAKQRPSLIAQPVLLGNFQTRVELPAGIGDIVKQPDETEAAFLIPAGAKNHVEEVTWTWKLPNAPFGIRAYYAGTHMHYVGRDMQVILENTKPAAGEEARECLVHTPRWDFNWQGGYGYDATYEQYPLMNPGDVLRMRCVYDNTLDNPYVATALKERGLTAPVDVRLGEDTLDEMCLAAIGLVYPNVMP